MQFIDPFVLDRQDDCDAAAAADAVDDTGRMKDVLEELELVLILNGMVFVVFGFPMSLLVHLLHHRYTLTFLSSVG